MGETIRERIARILEPQAWRALGAGDTLAYRSRRTSSQRKADAILNILSEPGEEDVERVARGLYDEDPIAMQMFDSEDIRDLARAAIKAFLSDGGR
jgi:hypothetical protein